MNSVTEEIKNKLDILSVITPYVPSLKRSGRNHFGLCPFHNEKSPSFSVNTEMGFYKCFGCGEGGDIFTFIEKIEGVDFPEALELLAKKAGVELEKYRSEKDKAQQYKRKRIFEANLLTAKYYHYLLLEHEAGSNAREYCQKRQLQKPELKKFLLGYAPVAYENLKNFLLKKGFSAKELLEFGLLVEKNGRIYDKFRARLMFPIFNTAGDIIGFSGRIIDPQSKAPKYLNSPETPVYHKSEFLYGLFQAKEALRKSDFAIVVEGNVDILSSHRVGLGNIVAPLGTALTEQQLKLLKRYVSKVYFALDNDNAGEKALLRSLELAEQVELDSKVVELGTYKDVDELICNGENWHVYIQNAKSVVDFVIEHFVKKYDLRDASQKAKYIHFALNFVAKLRDEIKKSHYLQELAHQTKIDFATLQKELEKIKSPLTRSESKPVMADVNNVSKGFVDEKYLCALLYHNPEFAKQVNEDDLSLVIEEKFPRQVIEYLLKPEQVKISEVPAEFQSLLQEVAQTKMVRFENNSEFTQELNSAYKRVVKRVLEEKIKAESSPEKLKTLLKKLKEYS